MAGLAFLGISLKKTLNIYISLFLIFQLNASVVSSPSAGRQQQQHSYSSSSNRDEVRGFFIK